jgi:GNAT superfamily N-acetyltransferase
MYEAFREVADRHGFPPDFTSAAAGRELAASFIADPTVFSVVAEIGGVVAGSNFLSEGDPIRGVGPITVDARLQGQGVGRALMTAVLERGARAEGVRLVQDAFNTRSFALYTSLGFAAREPLLLLLGTPKSAPMAGFSIRELAGDDLTACAQLARRVHGFERIAELRNALKIFRPFVVERDGRITGYLSAATLWLANHGVAETEDDMRALLVGAAAASSEPLSLLMPARQAGLLRWCLSQGLRIVKPMTLMTTGAYHAPNGAYFPSVFY